MKITYCEINTTAMTLPKLILELSLSQITHFRADSNYTIIHTRNGREVVSGYSLKTFQELLRQKNFVRIDRSYLVHRSFILNSNFTSDTAYITLRNDEEIIIPRRKRDFLKNLLTKTF
ncbi:MAG: LytTR family transcriptional regulator [Cytophagales bacterium]|nr:LytTR family transcriptional regulator [Cytophagales bacterium]